MPIFLARLPLIQAPMAGAQDTAMAIAVANAGGVGSLPAAFLSAAQLAEQLDAMLAQTKPDSVVNVNFFVHEQPALTEKVTTKLLHWQSLLVPYYESYGLDTKSLKTVDSTIATSRTPLDSAKIDVLQALWDKHSKVRTKPLVVSCHFGLPSAGLLASIQAMKTVGAGVQIWSSATTVAEGQWLAAQGVDAVIAQGLEAGGHRGVFLEGHAQSDWMSTLPYQMGTFALLPQMVKSIDVPVVAAGGIADAAGVRAALGLGATAVQVGTSFLLCDESRISAAHRALLLQSQTDSTLATQLTNVMTGRPARGFTNKWMSDIGALTTLAPEFPLAAVALGQIKTAAEKVGRTDFTSLWAGQNTSGAAAIPAAQMVKRLMGLE